LEFKRAYLIDPLDPGYDPAYQGGAINNQPPYIWIPAVLAREQALIDALAARFDNEPYFEAMNFTETAGGNLTLPSYTADGYFNALVKRMKDTKRVFSHTNVMQYANWYSNPVYGSSSQALAALADAIRLAGGGWGGPDIVPDFIQTGRQYIPAYDSYAPNAGLMPLGASVQNSAMGGSYGTFTAQALYNQGITTMHLNYMFWIMIEAPQNPPGFTASIVPYVDATSGWANSGCPVNVAPCSP